MSGDKNVHPFTACQAWQSIVGQAHTTLCGSPKTVQQQEYQCPEVCQLPELLKIVSIAGLATSKVITVLKLMMSEK